MLGLTAAACGTTSGTPTTSSTSSTVAGGKHAVLSVAAIRQLYLADSKAADAAFTSFTTQFSSNGNPGGPATVASPAEASAATKTAKALQKSAAQLADLAAKSPTKIATDLRALLGAENVVYQGLRDLVSGYQSRAFNLSGWENSFGLAASATDQAAAVVGTDLGLPPVTGNTATTSTLG
jgi:hypothetical protein